MTATHAAAMASAEPGLLPFGDEELACLYVVVDSRSRSDVADFLMGWHNCSTEIELDWQPVRRPATALVGVELVHCCEDDEHPSGSLRLVFDIRRDRESLEHLASTESLVVGNRPWGGFGNHVVAYSVDGNAVRQAIAEADASLGVTVV